MPVDTDKAAKKAAAIELQKKNPRRRNRSLRNQTVTAIQIIGGTLATASETGVLPPHLTPIVALGLPAITALVNLFMKR